MTPILKSLAWKEFRELQSSTVAAAAIVLAIPLCYIFRDLNLAYLGVHTALWIYPVLAGVFFGMRAAAGERTNRTAPFVGALPVSHTLLGTVRLLALLLAAAVPLALLLLLGAALAPHAEASVNNQAFSLGAVFGWTTLGTACCLTIVALGGMGQAKEIRAAVVGFAALVGVFIVIYACFMIIMTFLAMLSVGHFFLNREFGYQWPAMVGAIGLAALAGLFGVLFANTYSRALDLPSFRNKKSWNLNEWMPAPIPAHISILLWKGLREMGVLGLYVFLLSLLISILVGSLGLAVDPSSAGELVLKALPAILWIGGFVLAILIGVGAVMNDLQPGVNTFWRSRPIPPSAWYWTKYLIGLATILVAIEIPFLLNPHAQDISDHNDVWWWPLIWNVTFSFALTATCLIRQPAHAAILAVGTAGILYALVQATFGSFTPGEPPAPMAILAPIFLIAFALSTLLGAWAAKHDVAIS